MTTACHSRARIDLDGHGADESLANCRLRTQILVAVALTALPDSSRSRSRGQFRGLCAFHGALVPEIRSAFHVD